VLIGTSRRATLLGGFLRLAAVPPEVSQVLRSSGLDRYLATFPTVSAAASAASTPSSGTGGARQATHPGRSWSARPGQPARLRRVLGPDIGSAVG
jgi:hypothetical protein